ncbi:MAG: NAD(P)H-dependent oxidoreductase subunit E [Clostridia bacterium]|nr:NAD(P)H-dependent oxidoreductase subunit E [Clostridia bacterium]
MIVQVCVGSSCHIRGSDEIVTLFQNAISEHKLENDVTLVGSFCIGKCSPNGVSVQIDDEVLVGVNRQSFNELFNEKVLGVIKSERE